MQFLLSYVVETSLGDPDTAIIASPVVLPVMSLLFTILECHSRAHWEGATQTGGNKIPAPPEWSVWTDPELPGCHHRSVHRCGQNTGGLTGSVSCDTLSPVEQIASSTEALEP